MALKMYAHEGDLSEYGLVEASRGPTRNETHRTVHAREAHLARVLSETAESNIQEDCRKHICKHIGENEHCGSPEVKAELSCGTNFASSVEYDLLVKSVDDDNAEKDCELVSATECASKCNETDRSVIGGEEEDSGGNRKGIGPVVEGLNKQPEELGNYNLDEAKKVGEVGSTPIGVSGEVITGVEMILTGDLELYTGSR